ncbi:MULTISPECIES: copper chaperone PCu(A)C [Cupriavidus]
MSELRPDRQDAGVARTAAIRCWRAPLAALVLVCFGSAAAATSDVVVTDAWARPTVPGQPVGAAYLSITSARGATLTGVQSDVAGTVQVHSMSQDGDVMRMRQLDRLALPAGKMVRLAPAGTHLMLLQLKKPLRPGDSVALDLMVVDQAGGQHVVHAIAPVRTTPPEEGKP